MNPHNKVSFLHKIVCLPCKDYRYWSTIAHFNEFRHNMFSFFTRNKINQAYLIPALNRISNKLSDSIFNAEGICAALCNIYIDYASQGKRDTFFQKIQEVLVHQKDLDLSKDLKVFYIELAEENQNDDVFLKNQKCQDAFSFVASDQAQLKEQVKQIIQNFQKYNKDVYAHVTLGHTHSFVLEQTKKNGKMTYYVYDPNNPDLPRPLTTTNEIVVELNAIINRIKFCTSSYYDYLTKNTNLLFTFYVYPANEFEEKDKLINRLQNKIEKSIETFHDENKSHCDFIVMSSEYEFKLTDLPGNSNSAYILYSNQLFYIEKTPASYRVLTAITDKESLILAEKLKLPSINLETGVKSQCLIENMSPEQLQILTATFSIAHEPKQLLDLHDAKWCLEKYSRNKMAKGILLNNLLTLPHLLDDEKEIKKELENHLLSSDLLSKDYKEVPCYPYMKGNGNVSLLHETARIGDLKATQLLLKISDPLLENFSKMTPLECAMCEGYARIVNEMFSFMYTANQQSSSKYPLNYDRILAKAYSYLSFYPRKDLLYTAFRRNLKLFSGHEEIEKYNQELTKEKYKLVL